MKFNCRNEKNREQLVKKYEIIPIAHVKLLNGQQKTSCTSNPLTDSYYLFEYRNKLNIKDSGTFYCGLPTATHFLSLTNQAALQCFNPLQVSNMNGTASAVQGQGNNQQVKWNEMQFQFYIAITLLVICWNKPIQGLLAKFLKDAQKYKTYKPFEDRILRLNNMIGKDAKGRSLSEMLEELRVNNPNLKHYKFDLLEEVLHSKDIESNFS